MNFSTKILGLCLLLGLPSGLVECTAQTDTQPVVEEQAAISSISLTDPDFEGAMAELARGLLEQHDVPSVSIAIIAGGQLVYDDQFGLETWGKPADEKTLYNVASLTKPVVAETVMRLIEAGDLALDEPLAQYFTDPDVAEDPRIRQLTPEIVMRHETGFPNWRYETDWTLTFLRDPGEAVGYSGEGFEWMAKAVEVKLGEPFEDITQRLVFDPIGMERTGHILAGWMVDHLAVPYAEGQNVFNSIHREDFVASDDMRTNVRDYARFMIDVFEGNAISSELRAEQLTAERYYTWHEDCADPDKKAQRCAEDAGLGMGWFRFVANGDTIYQHTGGDQGEKALAFYIPERKFGIVIATNGANGNEVMFGLAKALYDNSSYYEMQ